MKISKYFFLLILILTINGCIDKTVNLPDEKQKPPGYQQDIPWPSLADGPWPMSHHDPQSSGRFKGNGPSSGLLDWQISIPGINSAIGFTDFAIGNDSTIYFGSSYEQSGQEQMSYLYALTFDGKVKWKYPLNHPFVETGPIISSDNEIYIGSGDKNLYAITHEGQLKWKYQVGSEIFQAGINIDKSGNIYFTSNDGKLTSVDSLGNLRWQIFPDGGLRSSSESGLAFSPDGNTLYAPGHVGRGSKSLYAISNMGEIKWTFGSDEYLTQPMVDFDGNIYVGYNNSKDSSYYGFLSLLPSGEKRWVYHTEVNPYLATIDKNGNIYFSAGSKIISLDFNGILRWENVVSQISPTSALNCDSYNRIYYAGNNFVCFNNDGTLIYTIPNIGFNYCTPAIGFERCFLGSSNNSKLIYSVR